MTDNLHDLEICNYCKFQIDELLKQKQNEVMKNIGTFVYNPNITIIDKKIAELQNRCTHLYITHEGQCEFCHKQVIKK